ncbi:MAG: hypothetical protein FD138_1572 [Planctomycetota bacterium]|nr:MAG: hypothetical protein FD138_1572 [Planctomycetota bacterium]
MNLSTRNGTADDLPWPVTMRFMTVLLSCNLLALSCGSQLTVPMAKVCHLSGLVGLALYFSLELVAHYRVRAQSNAASRTTEQRLSCCLRDKSKIAAPHCGSPSSPQENAAGHVESAMDSKADFEAYLGPNTQPTLSV